MRSGAWIAIGPVDKIRCPAVVHTHAAGVRGRRRGPGVRALALLAAQSSRLGLRPFASVWARRERTSTAGKEGGVRAAWLKPEITQWRPSRCVI